MGGIIKKYWITILLAVVITVLCFVDSGTLPEAPMTDFDKLVHFLMFGIFAGVVYFNNSFCFRKPVSYRRLVLGSFLFPIIFSGLIEVGQEYLTAHRKGDWMDFLYDFFGSFVGFAICIAINRRIVSRMES